ncbi:MAG: NADH-quinone oxidoreductase subunit M [Planctomycetota bacterium]
MNLPLVILLLPAFATLAIFAVPASKPQVVKGIAFLATLGVLVASVFLAVTFGTTDAPSETVRATGHVYKHVMSVPWVPALGLQFKLGVDGMGVAMVLLTALTIFTGVCVSFSVKERAKEFFLNLLALVTGVFGVFVSLDLFFYYFFYELAVIPMFLLIGCWGSTTKTMSRDYASMKLVLMLTTGAVFALLGLLAMYTKAGSFDMVRLEQLAATGTFSRAFQLTWFPPVFLGFAALVPMWPLHSWSPGGHAAAPAAVSMLHAGVLMKIGAYGILRVAVTYMPEAAQVYLPWVGVLCCFNIVYGGLVAMAQKDMKFVVGYSSSSHMGYVLLGIATANLIGVQGAVYLMFAHGVMTALAFSLIGFFYEQTHTRMLEDLGGLMKRLPFVGTCFVIMSMASAGLPGFANFVSELLVIIGAWHAGMYVPAILATWGIVVTGVYLLRTVKSAFLGKMPARWEGLEDARTPFQKLPFVLLVSTLLLFGFWPAPLLSLIRQGVTPIVASLDKAAQKTAAETGQR